MDKVIIESSLVNSIFKCSLCNDLIHLATVINECLHRFCKLCIINYFEKNDHKTCPICQIILVNPLETLKSDLIFQRLLYKIFQHKFACQSFQLISNNQIETKINVYLEYWDISLDLFSKKSSILLSNCYLECFINTPLLSIEKFLRIKHSLSSKLKIDLFYKTFLLNIKNERLIDICYCFDIINKNSILDIRFIVSPYGYKSILKCIHQSKQSIPLEIKVTSSNTNLIDSKLKVKLCRSQSSTNNWYISQSSNHLPDIINSCKKKLKIFKKKSQRRIRFIPTMVQFPPSIFDCLYENFDRFQSNEMIISNTEIKQIEKTICKVPPYIPENLSICKTLLLEKSLLNDDNPLDLSLK